MATPSRIRTLAWALLFPAAGVAQSTFGIILGTVTDQSGALLPKATVTATNTDENKARTAITNGSGDYEFVNSKPGRYRLEVRASGFQDFEATNLQLAGRQALRVDVRLQVGAASSSLNVEGTAGVITTDSQAIQSSLDSRALLDLPVNTRAGGSTSAYPFIGVLPGVQPDDSGGYSIQGGIPSMSQFSVDGISITDVRVNGPLMEAFPSLESIAEVKVQGAGSTAEFGELGDLTTISRSGTNERHGALFWYHQNRALDAIAYGQQAKPQKIGNDFGASGGGPVLIPHLYNGRNKTFFFGAFETLRFPLGATIQNTVPTNRLRGGDFSQASQRPNDPLTGEPFPNGLIPASRISSVARGFLTLYPLPNAGDLTTVHAANYIDNRDSSINTAQYDLRIDHYLRSAMALFGRWSWKGNTINIPQSLSLPGLTGTDAYKLAVVSWNWTLRPNLVNEFRFGITLNSYTQRFPFPSDRFANALGLAGIGPSFTTNNLPYVAIDGYDAVASGRDSLNESRNYQWNNNTNWSVGRHTLKFGFDIRRLQAVIPLFYLPGDNHGNFFFSSTFSGDPFVDFLLGLPDHTIIDPFVGRDTIGQTVHYGVFAQDTFRLNTRLTLEYGLRWEYHPGYLSVTGNIGNFDPAVPRSGAVIYPTGKQDLLAEPYLGSFNACPAPPENGVPCTPVLSAMQAHVPESLRFAPARVAPRFGFALRPFSDDKTVVRGGVGVYDTPSLGQIYIGLDSTLQADLQNYSNISANGRPIFEWPQTSTANAVVPPFGTAAFVAANQIHWKEPYTMQWDLSVDRNLGFNTGLRVSYIGMVTRDLVWDANINQSGYSTEYYASQPLSRRPFPNWGMIQQLLASSNANYGSAQLEVSHRFQHGLIFDSTFTFAKNLADNQGPAPGTAFAAEAFNGLVMDSNSRRAGYGDVSATRRQRWITTVVYDLPFGRGHALLSHVSRIAQAFISGWRVSSIVLVQSGPYETPYFSNGDPSGTGSGMVTAQLPDRIRNGSLTHPSASQWIDPTAFVCPGVPNWTSGQPCTIGDSPGTDLPPIGRFGNSGISVVTGPGTINVSMGLDKAFNITERMRLRIGGSFTNILNHLNLADPQMQIDMPGFGQITRARGSVFGGYRTGQVSARLEF